MLNRPRPRPSPFGVSSGISVAWGIKAFLYLAGALLIAGNLLMMAGLSSSNDHSHSGGPKADFQAPLNVKPVVSPPAPVSPPEPIHVPAPPQPNTDIPISPQAAPSPSPAPVSPVPFSPPSGISSDYSRKSALWSHPASNDCEGQFGNGFTERVLLCDSLSQGQFSALECRYNERIGGSICDARNIMFDPSKIRMSLGDEEIIAVRGRQEDDEFPKYSEGAFQVQCQRGPKLISNLPEADRTLPVHLQQMFVNTKFLGQSEPALAAICAGRWIDRPAMIITRYEYANLYHTLTDWYNAYQAEHFANLHERSDGGQQDEIDIIFIDGHSKGALDEGWAKLFPNARVRYIKRVEAELREANQPVTLCYRRAVFPSPGYRSALSVDSMSSRFENCRSQPPLIDFSKYWIQQFVAQSFQRGNDEFRFNAEQGNLPVQSHTFTDAFGDKFEYNPLDSSPLVVFIFRREYLSHPRVNLQMAERKLANEQAIVARLKAFTNIRFLPLDFARLTLAEQSLAIFASDVLIGVHGAALSYILFSRPSATLLELLASDFAGRPHFRYFSNWIGRKYETLDMGNSNMQHTFSVDVDILCSKIEAILGIKLSKASRQALPEPSPQQPAAAANGGGSDDSFRYDPNSPGSPSHRLCIIIPFRDSSAQTSQGGNRTANLRYTIPYLISHLKNVGKTPNHDFEIIVVEQTQGHVFNKGALFNAGYSFSKPRCDYMVLHDVDQVPMSPLNKYDFPGKTPRHMCTASSQFGGQMAYGSMVGGALCISMAQYEALNGYSNYYWGWGQEDDDFYYRIARTFGDVERLGPSEGRYRDLPHPRVKDLDVTPLFTRGRVHLLDTRDGRLDTAKDGISNLQYQLVNKEPKLFGNDAATKYTVELKFDFMPIDLQGNTKQQN